MNFVRGELIVLVKILKTFTKADLKLKKKRKFKSFNDEKKSSCNITKKNKSKPLKSS
jgi:hypothetical protein